MRFFKIVKPRKVVVLERLGKFTRILEPGFHIMIPFIDSIRKEISLKEKNINIKKQSVITKDNVEFQIDGVLYCKISDPLKATYESTDAFLYTKELAKSLLRCEIGKITLDNALHEREKLNLRLLNDIKEMTNRWGVEIKRYEIKTIYLDDDFVKLMNLEADSERYKKTKMLNAEAFKISSKNNAEREKEKSINVGKGLGKSLNLHFSAYADKINTIQDLLISNKITHENLSFKLKEDLISSLKGLSQKDKTILLKKDLTDFSSVFKSLDEKMN